MKKPVIGIVPLVDDERESLWMLPGYMDGITAAGGLPLMLPLTSEGDDIIQILDICDGILFTGGHDVSPDIYGMIDEVGNVVSCKARDDMELKLLNTAMEKNIPLLGICRGIQFINAALGGTLYQDIPTQHPTGTEHHQSAPYDEPVHSVNIKRDSPLHELLKKDTLQVNSYHHQAVRELAQGLDVMAVSEDGLVEAVRIEGQRFAWALQWHPEFSYKTDDDSMKIFSAFVSECKL